MSVSPGTYNISLQRRAGYEVGLQFKDSDGSPIDLTGWTVYAQAWNKERTIKFTDFSVTYTSRPNGQVSIKLTDAQTASFPSECFYDVLLENPSGLREYYLEGIIYVSEGYTAP